MRGKAIAIGLFFITAVILFLANTVFYTPTIIVKNDVGVGGDLSDLPTTDIPASGLTLYARLAISAVLLAAALFVVLSKRYPPQDKHWAYGALGAIAGTWLKA